MKINPEKTLLRDELSYYLTILKERINELNARPLRNVIFLSAESFFIYVRRMQCDGRASVEELLDLLEPYIPFTLCDGNIELFLSGIFLPEHEKELHQIRVAKKAKIDFLYTLKGINSTEEWEQLKNICEQLRLIHEKSINFHYV